MAMDPVPFATGNTDEYTVHNPAVDLVIRNRKPISVKPFVKAPAEVSTVAFTAPFNIYSNRIASPPPPSLPIAILYPSTVALVSVDSFAYSQIYIWFAAVKA